MPELKGFFIPVEKCIRNDRICCLNLKIACRFSAILFPPVSYAKSNLYFSEFDSCRLWHLKNQIRGLYVVVSPTILHFYGEELVVLRPTPNPLDQNLSSACDCTPHHVWRPVCCTRDLRNLHNLPVGNINLHGGDYEEAELDAVNNILNPVQELSYLMREDQKRQINTL